MANELRLTVDVREGKLLDALQHCFRSEVGEAPPTLQVAALAIGDAQIESADGRVRLYFERKTEADLAASIQDGRYREQKARLLATAARTHHCTYLVESPHPWAPQACSPKAYAGAILHTMYRDGMHVVVCRDVAASAEWIYRVFCKCRHHPAPFQADDPASAAPAGMEGGSGGGDGSGSGGGSYLAHAKIKTKKLDNIDAATCYRMQWGQVPGISEKLAEALAARFPSWRELFRALDACESDAARLSLLREVPLLGPKKAAKILEYMAFI